MRLFPDGSWDLNSLGLRSDIYPSEDFFLINMSEQKCSPNIIMCNKSSVVCVLTLLGGVFRPREKAQKGYPPAYFTAGERGCVSSQRYI